MFLLCHTLIWNAHIFIVLEKQCDVLLRLHIEGALKRTRFLTNIRKLSMWIWVLRRSVECTGTVQIGKCYRRKLHSFTLSLFTMYFINNFVLKFILANLSWEMFSCVQKREKNLMQHIFLYDTFKVFGLLLILHLQSLQPWENCSCDSVTEAFWYLFICEIISCVEFDYRNIKCSNWMQNFSFDKLWISPS